MNIYKILWRPDGSSTRETYKGKEWHLTSREKWAKATAMQGAPWISSNLSNFPLDFGQPSSAIQNVYKSEIYQNTSYQILNTNKSEIQLTTFLCTEASNVGKNQSLWHLFAVKIILWSDNVISGSIHNISLMKATNLAVWLLWWLSRILRQPQWWSRSVRWAANQPFSDVCSINLITWNHYHKNITKQQWKRVIQFRV